MHRSYEEFLSGKAVVDAPCGIDIKKSSLNAMLFDYQKDMVYWALRRGRAALFADCGIGKGPMQMEWADKQPHECIIAAPLAVAHQFVREAEKFGIDLAYAKDQAGITKRITVTNYERLENFHIEQFGAVALDESSILKNSSGAYCNWLIDAFKHTPFRLCSSATPAPNDVMELGTQAEFLGVMTRSEMLAMYFTHDGGDTSKWRVKGHAQAAFWEWMASWAVMIRKPSDLGYSDDGFVLPPLSMHEHVVKVQSPTSGFLFALEAQTLQERQQARRESISDRVKACAEVVMASFRNEDIEAWRARQKKTANTCELTTRQTSTSGASEHQKRKPSTTQNGERGTQTTLNSRRNIKSGHEAETPQRKGTGEFDLNLGLEANSTTGCSQLRMESAQSAVPNLRTQEGTNCTSTIAMQQVEYAGCCAEIVTSGSESSRTTLIDSERLHPTLRPWIVWCSLNAEQDALEDAFGDLAVSIRGANSIEEKEAGIMAFLNGDKPILISKPSVAGFGLNLQHCADMAFVGLSDSYEQLYQSIRRCWRFGQTRPVSVHVITAETEGAVVSNIKRKEREAEETYNNMIAHMKDLNAAALHGATLRNKTNYQPSVEMVIPAWMGVAA